MPYNIKQLGEKSVSIDFFIADPTYTGQGDVMCSLAYATISSFALTTEGSINCD